MADNNPITVFNLSSPRIERVILHIGWGEPTQSNTTK